MPSPNLPQGIVDPLNAGFQAATCLALDAYNTVGNVTSIALPDAQSAAEPTAEWRNTINAAVRSFADYVQGLTPITALAITTFFRVPTYTTGATPAASGGNDGRLIYDTTTDRLRVNANGAWQSIATTGDVAGAAGVNVFAEGGAVDNDFVSLQFDEDHFAVVDNSDETVSIALATDLPLSILASGSAQSVVGRSAGSTGEHADIAGTGTAAAPQIFVSDGTAHFTTIGALGDNLGFLFEQDLTALSTNAFTDGTEAVGALGNVTVGGTANAGANWGAVNGTGIRLSATAGAFSSTTQTGPHFYFPITQLAGWRACRPFYIDIVCTTGAFANGNDRFVFGLWCVANSPLTGLPARLRAGLRTNVGGTNTIGAYADTAATGTSSVSPTAISACISPDGRVTVGYGTYSGGWPTFDYIVANVATGAGDTIVAATTARVVFGLNCGAGGTPSIDISRWRFRQ